MAALPRGMNKGVTPAGGALAAAPPLALQLSTVYTHAVHNTRQVGEKSTLAFRPLFFSTNLDQRASLDRSTPFYAARRRLSDLSHLLNLLS